jgi:diaminohydroxyphosphoribosylaminopyrimidine deaminase/5-amino-6-(5-phosphoribosylamino)uracil reductase
MDTRSSDEAFMRRALSLAERGRGAVEPNPMVGAVVVKDGCVVGEGYYRSFGGPHAEVHALRAAGESSRGATLYVTLEPCDHQGKTPSCAPMVAQSGLARVVTATLDPTSVRPAGGLRLLQERGITAEVGLCCDEAVRLNAGFFKLAATGRPLVIAKWAMSADGKIATTSGASRWISSDESRRFVHALRGLVDAVVIGVGTAVRDDPLLTCHDAERRRIAARVVVCGRRVPGAESKLVRSAADAPVLLAYPAESRPQGLDRLAELGCEPLPVQGDGAAVAVPGLLDALGARRMTNVLVEGGARLLGSLFDAGQVDRVMAFCCPLVMGGAGAPAPLAGRGAAGIEQAVRLLDARWRPVGPDILLEGWAVDPLQWTPAPTGGAGAAGPPGST